MNPEPDSPPEPVPLAPRPKSEESEATKPVATVDEGRHSGERTPTPAIEREIPPARVAGGRHLDESEKPDETEDKPREERTTWQRWRPFVWALALTFVWGLCGGVFLNMGRTLFQESAPESHRGRALSVYTLGLLGMAPLGTQTAGWIGQAVGAATGCVLAGLAMCGLIAASWILTEVRNFD